MGGADDTVGQGPFGGPKICLDKFAISANFCVKYIKVQGVGA